MEKVSNKKSLTQIKYAHLPNGVRYPLVGETRQRYFIGTNFRPRKVPENAQTPTSRVHAVLGRFLGQLRLLLKKKFDFLDSLA